MSVENVLSVKGFNIIPSESAIAGLINRNKRIRKKKLMDPQTDWFSAVYQRTGSAYLILIRVLKFIKPTICFLRVQRSIFSYRNGYSIIYCFRVRLCPPKRSNATTNTTKWHWLQMLTALAALVATNTHTHTHTNWYIQTLVGKNISKCCPVVVLWLPGLPPCDSQLAHTHIISLATAARAAGALSPLEFTPPPTAHYIGLAHCILQK